MKKLTLGFLALAAALAITPAAMADTLCSATHGPITSATACSEGDFTFNFAGGGASLSGGPNAATDSVSFNSIATTGSGASANLGFTVSGTVFPVFPVDINLVYEVTGPAGIITIDNSFLGTGSITEIACTVNPVAGCPNGDVLANFTNSTGSEVFATFTSNTGTFWIDKDAEDFSYSEFNDSIDVAPEPSSLLLLGTGLLGLAFVAFRKAKPSGLSLKS